MPQFIVRQTLIIGITAGAVVLGLNLGATAAMLASAAAVWLAMLGQMIVLNRRLAGHIEPGTKAYDFRGWLAVSLPILMVEGFYLLLSYTDVLVLQQFRSSEEVGIYFAVVKTLALVSFIHFAMSATTAHRFAEYNALGDKDRPLGLCRACDPVDVLALARGNAGAARPRQAVALAVRAAIHGRLRHHVHPRHRPGGARGDRPGRAAPQHARPSAYLRAGLCAGFVMNLVLCVALVPRFGGHGAAAATSISLVFETVLLFVIVRRRLGLHVLAFGKKSVGLATSTTRSTVIACDPSTPRLQPGSDAGPALNLAIADGAWPQAPGHVACADWLVAFVAAKNRPGKLAARLVNQQERRTLSFI